MATTVKAYGVTSDSSPVKPLDIKRRELRDDDVEIDIEYCGVCHSDLHSAHGDWLDEGQEGQFPLVTGHEILGKVVKVGSKVKDFKVGEKVGVGCMVDSCKQCSACEDNHEQHCTKVSNTFGSVDPDFGGNTQGGYSQKIVVNDRFVVHIPDSLYGPAAAPLLCAGITTFSPLHRWGVKKGDKVGVAGYGGLGHMGVKFAAAMGAEVWIFTTSEQKAKKLEHIEGVKGAIVTTDSKQVEKHTDSFDFILNTVPVPHDFDLYTKLLKYHGTQVLVGVLQESKTNPKYAVMGSKVVAGSLIGGMKETQEMIDFCAKHNIVSDIEMTDFQHINEAWERVQKNDVRFRFVIDIASIEKEPNEKDQAIDGKKSS